MSEPQVLLSFGRCQLDLAARELTVDGDLIDLQPLVFDLLAYMAQNANRVIGKDELLHAVWRSPFVTDSVVSRAVMKARRAIMDDARAPKVLHTVQRIGYRFDGQVVHRTNARPAPANFLVNRAPLAVLCDLAILPWTGIPAAPAVLGSEVACLVHHLLERGGDLALLPMVDVLHNPPQLEPAADDLALACGAFGARAVVSFEVSAGTTGTLQLLMHHGPSRQQATLHALEGPSVWDLALQAVQALRGDVAGAGSTGPANAVAGLPPLGRALYQECCGTAAQALVSIEQAHAQLPPSAWLDLALARLLWKTRNGEQALAWVAKGLAQPEAQACVDLQVQLWLARGVSHESISELAEAAVAFERACQIAGQPNAAFDRRWDILSLWGQMTVRLGQLERGRRLAEQAVLHASAMNYVRGEASAKLGLGLVLTVTEHTRRAVEVVRQALQLATQCRNSQMQAYALRVQSLLLLTIRRFQQSIDVGRQAIALYMRQEKPALASTCRMNIYLALIDSDQLDLALQEQQHIDVSTPEKRRVFDGATAALSWKLGRCDEAIESLQRLCARNGHAPTLAQREYDYFLARHLIFLGRLDDARSVATRMEDDPVRERPMLVRADLAFAEGDRVGCMDLLSQVWSAAKHHSENVMDAGIDLAWLLLEDHGSAQTDDELESLVAHLLDYSSDYPAASLLTGAYLLRSMPTEASRARWDAAVRQARTLSRRYPQLTTAEFRNALEQGSAAPLPKLLTRMCQ